MLFEYIATAIMFEVTLPRRFEAIMDRVAFLARYGRVSPLEAIEYPRWFGAGLMARLARMIEDENRNSPMPASYRNR